MFQSAPTPYRQGVVSRIYSDLAVLELDRDERIAYLLELAPGVDRRELKTATAVPLEYSPSLQEDLIAEAP